MMCAHEDVVATVVLLVVHMPGSSSGPSSGARRGIDQLQVGRVIPTARRHLDGWMELRELHPTMGLRLAADGLRELQPRNRGGADAFRVNPSAPRHLGLAGPTREGPNHPQVWEAKKRLTWRCCGPGP